MTRLRCAQCGGSGEVTVTLRTVGSLGDTSPRELVESEPCETCDGEGGVLCASCGERDAITDEQGVPECHLCARGYPDYEADAEEYGDLRYHEWRDDHAA
jgi:hypothetical protein